MKFPIQLIWDLVAIQPEQETSTSVLLPDWKRALHGKVIAKSKQVKSIKLGDRVTFNAAKGMDSVVNGKMIRVMREDDVEAVYT